MAEGKDYCERKINLLKSNFDQLIEVSFSFFKNKMNFDCSLTHHLFGGEEVYNYENLINFMVKVDGYLFFVPYI